MSWQWLRGWRRFPSARTGLGSGDQRPGLPVLGWRRRGLTSHEPVRVRNGETRGPRTIFFANDSVRLFYEYYRRFDSTAVLPQPVYPSDPWGTIRDRRSAIGRPPWTARRSRDITTGLAAGLSFSGAFGSPAFACQSVRPVGQCAHCIGAALNLGARICRHRPWPPAHPAAHLARDRPCSARSRGSQLSPVATVPDVNGAIVCFLSLRRPHRVDGAWRATMRVDASRDLTARDSDGHRATRDCQLSIYRGPASRRR